jgi:signal transduction histidine kinase
LGLHICYNLMTSILGGSIMLDTETTQGCAFILVLPLHAPRNAAG